MLVSGATATRRQVTSDNMGCLIVPGSGNSPFPGKPWAADNGAFTGFDAESFLVMLERLRAQDYSYRHCLFVAAPDVLHRRDGQVVGDAAATLAKFRRWAIVIRAFGFPVALVAQDGLTVETTPWIELDALFIGGSTEWKLGPEAEALARAAKANRKWVHMGRVNTFRRVKHAARIGCDSFDGTAFSKWSNVFIPKGLSWIERSQQQPHLL